MSSVFIPNAYIIPLPAVSKMNFMLRFLLNLSVTPLPAAELDELYVNHLFACAPEEDL